MTRRVNSRFGPALALAGASLVLTTSSPAQTTTRQAADQPFADTSIWNTPLGRGAVFQSDTAAETAMIHSDDVGYHSGSYAWIAVGAFGVYRAKESDPLVRWTFERRSATAAWPAGGAMTNGSIDLRTPSSVQFLGGSDGHAVLIDPTGQVAYEAWIGKWDSAHRTIHANYLVRVDLKGSGIASGEGRSEGIRGFGGSLLGGLVRCEELRRGEIPHAVAMVFSTTMLRKSPTMAGQKVWPASMSDGGGKNNYTGLVPMGALIGIRPDVDIASLGLTREGAALARAYQRFGGYVVDASVGSETLAVTETGCDKAATSNLFKDVRKVRDKLVRVLNNSPKTVGGSGKRVASAPPPLDTSR